jgi:hypothetical protein
MNIEPSQSTSILSDTSLVETVKEYLSEDRYHIQLSELIFEETETAFKAIYEDTTSLICIQQTEREAPVNLEEILEEIKPLAKKLDRLSTTLLLVCFYGKETAHELVEEAIKKMATPPSTFRIYPVLHLLYVCGMGHIMKKKNYKTFFKLMSIEALPSIGSTPKPLIQ